MTGEAPAARYIRIWWKELWVQVMIAMVLGVALGVLRPELAVQMQPLGDAFIKAIRMLIAPIIFCTVVSGIAHMADMARVGRVAIKAILYFELITTFALIIGLVAVNLLQPGAGMNVDPLSINASVVEPYVKQTAVIGLVPFLMNIIPQTSTIASHLPRAVGVAFSIARAKKLGVPCPWPDDAITVCSFGDASVNHSTAVGAINATLHSAYQGVPMPLLFVCEDNGIGISVKTPQEWIARTYGNRDGLRYFAADGSDLAATFDAAAAAAAWVRSHRRPAFLHLRMVRLMGHAGSDYEPAYRRPDEIAADFDRDPVLCTAKLLISHGALTPAETIGRYEAKRANVIELATEAAELAQLDSAQAVMQPITASLDEAQAIAPVTVGSASDAPVTVALAINRALQDILDRYPEAMIFGEDVARKGGVYGVTRGLLGKASSARVFDTLLDEQSILGLGLGAGVSGLLPIPEIQYLAYFHNAADQIRVAAARQMPALLASAPR